MKHETFIEKYIPSSDVRRMIRESSHSFSDWERAAIIWNSHAPLPDKWEELQIIAEETTDAKLHEQICERLAYDREAYRVFKNNTEGFVYTVNSYWLEVNEEETPIFGNSEIAYREGCRCCGGSDFEVEKNQVINENTEIMKVRGILSPLLETDEERQMEEYDTCGVGIATCWYNKDGELMSLWSCELPKEQDQRVNALGKDRFENRFVVFPNPFEKDEKVRIIKPGNRYGLSAWIRESQKTWEERIKRACSEDGIEDYSDASLMVEYWDESNRRWAHDHINPIYLERDTIGCPRRRPTENQMVLFNAVRRELIKRANGRLSEDECAFIAANFANKYDFNNSALGHKSAGSWAKILLEEL